MISLVLTVAVVFVILVASELWWRTRRPHGEISRKFVHISVGSFAAAWPWYLSDYQILVIAGAFIVGVMVSKYLHLFQAIHAVQRPTWGELCFALSVGILAIITTNPWMYAVALLHMALADGFAAVIGTRYGHSTAYQVFGHTKSLVGSATFFVISVALLFAYAAYGQSEGLGLVHLALIASVATLLENVAVRGLDNLSVPLFVATALMYTV